MARLVFYSPEILALVIAALLLFDIWRSRDK